jgi:hypothetical protein
MEFYTKLLNNYIIRRQQSSNQTLLGDNDLVLSRTHRDILPAPHPTVPFLDLGDVSTTRVSSHIFITQQVVGNNVHELTGGGSCEV